jgi:23S rRNA (uracil1939-C5)-methyltransferase
VVEPGNLARLTIERIGRRGEGLARWHDSGVAVPYALAGETIMAEIDGDRARLVEIVHASPDRIAAICPYFGRCGGCAVQTLSPKAYAAWKSGLVGAALQAEGLDAKVAPMVDAWGEGRRRATLHARVSETGSLRVGFMESRSHAIVSIDHCPILAPAMGGALLATRRLASILTGLNKPIDFLVTATQTGLDIDMHGVGRLPLDRLGRLAEAASQLDLARLSNHGETLVLRREPFVVVAGQNVRLPPGSFLQATSDGETILSLLARESLSGAKRVIDLFCGVGTFALSLADTRQVHAVDVNQAALAALQSAHNAMPKAKHLTVEQRDLFRQPIIAAELDRFDGVVFDPPRVGALEQAGQIAKSRVPVVVAISCNPTSFARDARILVDGGYRIDRIVPIDQFRYSAHVEIVAEFRQTVRKTLRRAPLLG